MPSLNGAVPVRRLVARVRQAARRKPDVTALLLLRCSCVDFFFQLFEERRFECQVIFESLNGRIP